MLANIESLRGNPTPALEHAQRALEIGEASFGRDQSSLGPEHPLLACPLASLAAVARLRGDTSAARTHAARALAVLEANDAPEPELLASVRLELARTEPSTAPADSDVE